MNFTINLATKIYVDFRKVNIAFALIALVLLLWGGYSAYTCAANAGRLGKFAAYRAGFNKGSDVKKVSESEYTAFLANVKSTNSIIYKRSYDWLSLLSNLERLVPEGVALRGVEPSEKGSVIKLSGSARNFAVIRKFVENLEASKVFGEINLTDQIAIREGNPKGFSFTVTCRVSSS